MTSQIFRELISVQKHAHANNNNQTFATTGGFFSERASNAERVASHYIIITSI